jgi:hypothetical protein
MVNADTANVKSRLKQMIIMQVMLQLTVELLEAT